MSVKRQRGLSVVGVLVVGALAAFVLLVAFRTVPAVTEYLAVQRIVRTLAEEGDNGVAVLELRRGFDRRRQIDDVSSVAGVDLVISKPGGRTLIEVDYARRIPVVANVSLLIDFHVSSEGR